MSKRGINSKGKLKKGFFYETGGKVVRAKKKTKTKLYRQAAALGSVGGKATASKRKTLRRNGVLF